MADFLLHLLRGGSWYDPTKDCRSANRSRSRSLNQPGIASSLVGFRVVCLHQTGHAIRLEELADV